MSYLLMLAMNLLKEKNQNKLSVENVEKIVSTYKNRATEDKYAYLASFDEIKENDFNLNIPRYVDTFEEEESIDMKNVGNEVKQIRQEKHALEKRVIFYHRCF